MQTARISSRPWRRGRWTMQGGMTRRRGTSRARVSLVGGRGPLGGPHICILYMLIRGLAGYGPSPGRQIGRANRFSLKQHAHRLLTTICPPPPFRVTHPPNCDPPATFCDPPCYFSPVPAPSVTQSPGLPQRTLLILLPAQTPRGHGRRATRRPPHLAPGRRSRPPRGPGVDTQRCSPTRQRRRLGLVALVFPLVGR